MAITIFSSCDEQILLLGSTVCLEELIEPLPSLGALSHFILFFPQTLMSP